jgi:hypothetical protein
MKLFYDLRLGYLVTAPGQETALTDLAGKAGDGDEVIVQFGRSSDPTGTASIVAAQTWTPENLSGGTVITVGIKEDGDYSDGALLASNSTWSHDAVAFTYTGAISYNTTAINTALLRLDTNAGNDIALVECGFEITFQPGGSGPWRSSIYPIGLTLYHDILGGSEGTPTDADDPDEYLLKTSAAEYLPTVTSLTGGTAADLDAVPTVGVTVGKLVQFIDADPTPDLVRYYRLEAGTDAEASPNVIRPDDYNGATNAKIWRLYRTSSDNPMTTAGDMIYGLAGGVPQRLAPPASSAPAPVLKGSTSIVYWELPPCPFPTATDAIAASASLADTTYGRLQSLDTSAGAINLTLDAGFPVQVNFYFFAMKTSASNAGTLVRDTGVALWFNGTDADLVLDNGKIYTLWLVSANVWRVVSTS